MSDNPRLGTPQAGNGTDMVPHAAAPMPSLYGIIERAAKDPTFDLDKFKAMLDIYHQERADRRLQSFNQAMNAVQKEMRAVFRDKPNQHTKSRYSTLEAMDEVARPIYTAHGFSVTFPPETPVHERNLRLTCACSHNDGHVALYPLELPLDQAGTRGTDNKTAVQAAGSTLTYLRRYLFMLVWNIVLTNDETDDDGNASGGIRNVADGMGENLRRDPPPPKPTQQASNGKPSKWTSDALAWLTASDSRGQWQDRLVKLLDAAPTREDAVALHSAGGVQSTIKAAPQDNRTTMLDAYQAALARFDKVDEAAAEAAEAAKWQSLPEANKTEPEKLPATLLKDVEASEAERIIALIQSAISTQALHQIVAVSMVNAGSIDHLRTARPELFQRVEEARTARFKALGGEA